MAVVNSKSTTIAGADASPVVRSNANLGFGNVRTKKGICAVLSTDNIGSVYRFARVRSSDNVHSVIKRNTALAGSCTMDVGLYRTAGDGGLVVDADFFASAVSMVTLDAVGVDVTHEANTANNLVPDREKQIWQQLGLTVDPQLEYDVAFTCVAIPAANGSLYGEINVLSNA